MSNRRVLDLSIEDRRRVRESIFRNTRETEGGCWEWTLSLFPNGYGQAVVRLDSGSWMHVNAHRLAYYVTHDIDIAGLDICHHCDNRKCINPLHLFAGTRTDNMQDCIRKGRYTRNRRYSCGETHHSAKLTADDVRQIRLRLSGGEQHKIIAKDFGIARVTVSAINTKRIWKSAI